MLKIVRCVMGAENLPAFVDGMTNVVAGLTVWESREHSPDTQHTVTYRGVSYEVGSLTVNIDIVTDESWVEDILRRVAEASRLDEFSVRHVYIMPVEASYHIRNGFMDV
jgi:nitrogen regulatory protein PII